MAALANCQEQTRVLVVDDEENITDLLATALRYERFDVAVARNGREALEHVTDFRPHLIVLDVMLPDWDGFEVARRLGANGTSPAIVLVSSRDAADYGDLISSSGARGFVPKGELSGAALRALLP